MFRVVKSPIKNYPEKNFFTANECRLISAEFSAVLFLYLQESEERNILLKLSVSYRIKSYFTMKSEHRVFMASILFVP